MLRRLLRRGRGRGGAELLQGPDRGGWLSVEPRVCLCYLCIWEKKSVLVLFGKKISNLASFFYVLDVERQRSMLRFFVSDIEALLCLFGLVNIKTWNKTELGQNTRSHVGFFFPLPEHF